MLKGAEITVDNAFEAVLSRLDPPAQAELLRNREDVKLYIKARIKTWEIGASDDVFDTDLNDYPRTAGLGLQSVALRFKREGKAMLYEGEWGDPTLGVLVEGLLDEIADEIAWVLAGFPVPEGKYELLTARSPHLRMSDQYGHLVNSRSTEDMPRKLTGSRAVYGPKQAHTIIQKAKPDPAYIIRGRTNAGVYGCGFHLTPKF